MIRLRKLRKHMHRLRLRARRLREHHHMLRWRRARAEITRDQNAIHRVEEAHREGVDCSWGRPSPQSLHDAGKDFICLYLNDIDGFGMTKKDIDRYAAGDIDLVALFERGAEDAREGYKRGKEHGHEAIRFARHLKIPEGRPIYFAIDFDARGFDIGPYFVGLMEVFGFSEYRVGGYGSKTVMSYLFHQGLIDWGFQTYAWSHHDWDKRAHLRQVLIDLPDHELEIGGSKVDYCRTLALDFGQWRI